MATSHSLAIVQAEALGHIPIERTSSQASMSGIGFVASLKTTSYRLSVSLVATRTIRRSSPDPIDSFRMSCACNFISLSTLRSLVYFGYVGKSTVGEMT